MHGLSTKLLGVELDGGETVYSTGVTLAIKIQLNVSKTLQPVFQRDCIKYQNKSENKEIHFFNFKLSRPFL